MSGQTLDGLFADMAANGLQLVGLNELDNGQWHAALKEKGSDYSKLDGFDHQRGKTAVEAVARALKEAGTARAERAPAPPAKASAGVFD